MTVMGSEIEFKGYQQHQGQLFPAHLSEALDPGDPVFFINDLVEGLDLEAFERRYASMGEHAYPPRLLLKLWLFGAIEGVYSGREIAQRLRWDLRFRYLAGGLYPDFRTINRFRVLHLRGFRGGISADGAHGAGVGSREAGPGGDRREQDPGEHVASQGDEPQAHEAGRGRGARRRRRKRRSPGGAAGPRAAGREAAGGAGATRGGARVGSEAEQPEELCRSRRKHDDDRGGLAAVLLQRAGCDERRRCDRRGGDHDLAP